MTELVARALQQNALLHHLYENLISLGAEMSEPFMVVGFQEWE
jgi:hypothetical protein